MTKIRRLLKSRKGFSAPWAVVLALVGLMIFAAASQYFRMMIMANGVRDALQSAVIASATENYGNVYTGVREGYSGGYALSGGYWQEKISSGDIYGRLDGLLGLEPSGGKHNKYNNDGLEYCVYGLDIEITNAPFAPGDSGNTQQFTANSVITLEAPLSFCGDRLPPMKITLEVQSEYTPKF